MHRVSLTEIGSFLDRVEEHLDGVVWRLREATDKTDQAAKLVSLLRAELLLREAGKKVRDLWSILREVWEVAINADLDIEPEE